MPERSRLSRAAWVPLLAGLCWLWVAPDHGLISAALAVVPGCLLLGSGVAMLLLRGDRHVGHYAAAGGLIGSLVAFPTWLLVGFWPGLLLLGLSLWSFVEAGAHALRAGFTRDGTPAAIASIRLRAEVAADEAMLASVLPFLPVAGPAEAERINAEIAAARAMFEQKGWFEKPASYHSAPPRLEAPKLAAARVLGIDYEELRFESGYQPHPEEPGRERWLAYRANRTALARIVRHRDANRPWLICIHGFQMGNARFDLLAFPPAWLHHGLGLNLALPVLPLHGARKVGRRSGDGFLTGDLLDSIHAEAQAAWDLRRIVGWIRSQGGTRIGVLGLSLGAYSAALLSSLEEGLACVIAGIPLVDIPDTMIRHGLLSAMRDRDSDALDVAGMGEVMKVVSPLALEPKLPVERRYLFAAVADRMVPPEQAGRLWKHWGRPRIEWYQGAHMTFRLHPSVRGLVEEGLRASALAL